MAIWLWNRYWDLLKPRHDLDTQERPLSKGAGRHICDYSWSPPPSHVTSRWSLKIKRCQTVVQHPWMDPGSIDKKIKNVQSSLNVFCENDLWLPPELPQVTPRTPDRHHKMSRKLSKLYKYATNVKHISRELPNNDKTMFGACPRYHKKRESIQE